MSLLSTISKAAAGLALAAGLMATAIPATAMAAGPYTKDNPLKVVLVVHGTLGDKSFFDSAAAGLHQAEKDLPITLKIIGLIHWHAARLWFKRVPWFRKAARPADQRDLYRPHASLTAGEPTAAPAGLNESAVHLTDS